MNFQVVNGLNTTMAAHLRTLHGVTTEQVCQALNTLEPGYCRQEKYSEEIVLINTAENYKEYSNLGFQDPATGIYTLYHLNHQWRIGGFTTNKFINELEQLIRKSK